MGLLGKTMTALFPGIMASRREAQFRIQQTETAMRVHHDLASRFGSGLPGGGSVYNAASNKNSLASWAASSGSADADLLDELPIIRDRSQSLYNNGAVARGVIKRKVSGAIGSGLVMRSTIDRKLLGLNEDEAREWSDAAEREFRLWGDSRECDFARRLAFNEIQQLAFTSQKVRGDCFIIMTWVPRVGVPYDLRLQLIEADRVSNPNNQPDNKEIAGGIKRDVNGVPVSIFVQTDHPGNNYIDVVPEWQEVPIFGKTTGRRQVLHLMEFERIDQSRGEPSLAPVIETLKQLSRFSEAELSAAVVNALLTVFIERPMESDGATGVQVFYDEEEKKQWNNRLLQLGAGSWVQGRPGEKLSIISANRPSAQFDPFFNSCLKQIGLGLGVPYEVLSLVFQSSYSASRAALLEFGKEMKIVRAWLRNNLCQMVYEEFLTEAVIKGRLYAPGFLDDPIIRAAYCRAEWMGPSIGQIDPVKEVTASIMKIVAGLSTMGRETAELNGSDFEQNTYTRAEEFKLLKEMNLLLESMYKIAGQTPLFDPDTEGTRDAA
ncbi:MAG: phage portal protein [Planctomycetaceae bacterium]|nr:phage portal protein [Planctomycetaceae bacterium]